MVSATPKRTMVATFCPSAMNGCDCPTDIGAMGMEWAIGPRWNCQASWRAPGLPEWNRLFPGWQERAMLLSSQQCSALDQVLSDAKQPLAARHMREAQRWCRCREHRGARQ